MKFLHNKAGVTVLEGVIALGLLAVVTAGAFGVLLSASRKSTQPDMREEMVLAVEKAKDMLQVYIGPNTSNLPQNLKQGLCGGDSTPLNTGTHSIKCMLPRVCDATSSNSKFQYEVLTASNRVSGGDFAINLATANKETLAGNDESTLQIKFTIQCNGYEL